MRGEGEERSSPEVPRYLYADPDLMNFGILEDGRLAACSERHQLNLAKPRPHAVHNAVEEIDHHGLKGLVMELGRGYPSRHHLFLARKVRKAGYPVYFYWPMEKVVEVIDASRWKSFFKLYVFASIFCIADMAFTSLWGAMSPPDAESSDGSSISWSRIIRQIQKKAAPLALDGIHSHHVSGTGVYLRTDYWSNITAGGSYGHTCHVARKLAERTDDFVCLMANRFELLDDFGVHQVVVEHTAPGVEPKMLAASGHFYSRLKPVLEALRPSYIYERLVPGNVAGARLSQELGIPYLVEFNGSELSMARSFGKRPLAFESLFLEAEKALFQQATAISVVSRTVREYVVSMDVDPAKIFINPNCADPEMYCPPSDEERRKIRRELGYTDSDVVIGFIGSFGGWHGIEVLAKAIPRICNQVGEARFLMIGNGNLRHLIVGAVKRSGLQDKVHFTTMLPQAEAAVIMKACDVFVSPHHRNMEDGRFFGSPTKIFEYMALGGAIVASDLGQIGEVLSPALRPSELGKPVQDAGDAVSVLCQPGNVEEFVAAVTALARSPDLRSRMGANARRAVLSEFNWDRHVGRLFDFVDALSGAMQAGDDRPSSMPNVSDEQVSVDPYKKEIQRQWDNDPCGSHYVKAVDDDETSRLEWFKGIEQYRFSEYAPWMPKTMEFENHAGEKVLEIGGGMGTDLSRFAAAGSEVVNCDLSWGHLQLTSENLSLRGLNGQFVHGDAEDLPFADEAFDLVYTNGVMHHSPNTQRLISEMHRVLRPGGRVIAMVYAESSLNYWMRLVLMYGLLRGHLSKWSIGEIMSRNAEISDVGSNPLVKVYTRRQLRAMFSCFERIGICQRQLLAEELPLPMRWMPVSLLQKLMGWNLIVKAHKPKLE